MFFGFYKYEKHPKMLQKLIEVKYSETQNTWVPCNGDSTRIIMHVVIKINPIKGKCMRELKYKLWHLLSLLII